MGINYTPHIVSPENLLLYLDVGNIKSYDSNISSTDMYNISGRNIGANITTSMNFVGSNALFGDGNTMIVLSNLLNEFVSEVKTICFWINDIGNDNAGKYFLQGTGDVTYNGSYQMVFSQAGTPKTYINNIDTGGDVTNFVRQDQYYLWEFSGIDLGTWDPEKFNICVLNCYFKAMICYNKILTQEERELNYKMFSSRFKQPTIP